MTYYASHGSKTYWSIVKLLHTNRKYLPDNSFTHILYAGLRQHQKDVREHITIYKLNTKNTQAILKLSTLHST